MTSNEIDIFNASIYDDGKILTTLNGFTSVLIQRLFSLGYQAYTSGAVHTLYDDQARKVCRGYSWLDLLMTTAKTLK